MNTKDLALAIGELKDYLEELKQDEESEREYPCYHSHEIFRLVREDLTNLLQRYDLV